MSTVIESMCVQTSPMKKGTKHSINVIQEIIEKYTSTCQPVVVIPAYCVCVCVCVVCVCVWCVCGGVCVCVWCVCGCVCVCGVCVGVWGCIIELHIYSRHNSSVIKSSDRNTLP